MVVFRSKTTTCSLPVAMWMKSAYLPSYPSVPPLGTMPRAPLWLWLEDPQCLQVLEEGGLCFPFELKPAVNGVGEFHDGLGGGVCKAAQAFFLGKIQEQPLACRSGWIPAALPGHATRTHCLPHPPQTCFTQAGWTVSLQPLGPS